MIFFFFLVNFAFGIYPADRKMICLSVPFARGCASLVFSFPLVCRQDFSSPFSATGPEDTSTVGVNLADGHQEGLVGSCGEPTLGLAVLRQHSNCIQL